MDKSDQLVNYHKIARQTKKYWKTLFFHLLEISNTNAFILHKLMLISNQKKIITENKFRDNLILQIIARYGFSSRSAASTTPSSSVAYRSLHSSMAMSSEKRRQCAVCKGRPSRACQDCPFMPALCQTASKNCHALWHSAEFDAQRAAWFFRKRAKASAREAREQALHSSSVKRRPGRPKGSRDKKRRSVN